METINVVLVISLAINALLLWRLYMLLRRSVPERVVLNALLDQEQLEALIKKYGSLSEAYVQEYTAKVPFAPDRVAVISMLRYVEQGKVFQRPSKGG